MASATVGQIVMYTGIELDPETGEAVLFHRPAIVVQLRKNPNPPDPGMKDWADIDAFYQDGSVVPVYSFLGDENTSGSYFPLPTSPSEPAPAPTEQTPAA